MLGCTARVVPAGINWSLTEAKTLEWLESISTRLNEDSLPAGAASKLASRLGFASTKVFGRVGRAWIRPILWRHQHKTTACLRKNRRLRSSLRWWAMLLNRRPERLSHRAASPLGVPDVLVYTDAEGAGGVGVYVKWCASGREEFASGVVPAKWTKSLKKRKTQINAYELLAVVAAWNTWADELRGARVLCLIDNTAALNITVSGWSRHEDLNWMAGQCWLRIAASQCMVAWSWVPSRSNMADAPSRAGLSFSSRMLRRALRWPLPPVDWVI